MKHIKLFNEGFLNESKESEFKLGDEVKITSDNEKLKKNVG